jgi:DoxX-like protein
MTGYLHNFDVSNGVNVLRLICGLVFIPHIVGKFTEPATLNFFKAAKFNPPATWMYIAGAIETLLTIGLVSAIYMPSLPPSICSLLARRPIRWPVSRLGNRWHRILRILDAIVCRARAADLAEMTDASFTSPVS